MTCNTPNRVYNQYRNRPKIVSWYDITRDISDELCNGFNQIRTSYDIDTAGTAELDIIGRIVDVSRSYESTIEFDAIEWGDASSQFGGQNIQFRATTVIESETVSNTVYRLLIKAKIAKNNSDATLDGIASALNFIVSVDDIHVIDNENMTINVVFGSELSIVERFVLDTFDIIPRPQGVEFLGYTEGPAITQFNGRYGWGDSRAQFGQFF